MLASLIARYGWKTILGTLLLAAGQAAPYLPALSPYAPALNCVGVVLGGVGLRTALANVAPLVDSAIPNPTQINPSEDQPHA